MPALQPLHTTIAACWLHGRHCPHVGDDPWLCQQGEDAVRRCFIFTASPPRICLRVAMQGLDMAAGVETGLQPKDVSNLEASHRGAVLHVNWLPGVTWTKSAFTFSANYAASCLILLSHSQTYRDRLPMLLTMTLRVLQQQQANTAAGTGGFMLPVHLDLERRHHHALGRDCPTSAEERTQASALAKLIMLQWPSALMVVLGPSIEGT